MSKHVLPEVHNAHPNVTPLIDIVMCLIIFFMLVAKIGVSDGSDAKIVIPSSILGAKLESMANTLVLNVTAGAEQPIVTAILENQQQQQLHVIDPISGKKQLKESLDLLRTRGGEAFRVIIRGDAEMDYRYLEQVLISCAEAKVQNVSFVTRTIETTVAQH